MVGRTIAQYQVLEKVGEGGMGVVYKVRDTHLDRVIALKVLQSENVADRDRKARFGQEARAASALNHPNIVTIHDIGEADGVCFIAMEYVTGETLDELIGRKGLRLREALKYSIQLAGALAKAHNAGIVHRDLKPSNIMVTGDGLVKVLDFGLAKLTQPADDDLARTRTDQAVTQKGSILGTVAYMSPEQAEGKAVDARSDIFSFGSVLYEMVTGTRPFQGDSNISTLAAIIEREPPPLGKEVPHDLENLIGLCLRKEPRRRFQHMDDVCSLLEALKEESDSGRLLAVRPPQPRRWRRLAWGAGVAMVLIGAALALWSLWPDPAKPPAAWKESPLTSYPGTEHGPAFSPDGNQVAFCWDGPGQDNWDIYVKLIGVERPLRLTTDPAQDDNPAWSPDGRSIAFLRTQPGGMNRTILLVPAIGGPEQKVADVGAWGRLAWSPDGNWLAFTDRDSEKPGGQTSSVFAISPKTGERRQLTSAPSGLRDLAGAFSPDGNNLVFSRVRNWSGELYVLSLTRDFSPKGEPTRITSQGRQPLSPAWTRDGSEIVYASASTASSAMWRVGLSGSRVPRRLQVGGDQIGGLAISRQGDQLAYERELTDENIWRFEIKGARGGPGGRTKLIASTWADTVPQYSPDGRRIAFGSTRSGNNEIWVCRSDGSEPIQLTFLRGQDIGPPRWSPDGTRIVFDANATGNFEIYVVGAGGGRPRRLTNYPADNALASFSQDGRWVYFGSSRTGRFEIWRMPAEGGEANQITNNGGWVGFESHDGKHLYYAATPYVSSLWKVPLGGGAAEKIAEPVIGSSITLSATGVYFARPGRPGGGNAIEFLNFLTGHTTTITTTEHPLFWSMSVSGDQRYLLYSQYDQTGSDLMLVENFR